MKSPLNNRTKLIFCIVFVAGLAIYNINQTTSETTSRRELSSESFTYRYLSKNLGHGRCEWTPPEFLRNLNTANTTTVIASYPGSGKRLVWRIIEALTGEFDHFFLSLLL